MFMYEGYMDIDKFCSCIKEKFKSKDAIISILREDNRKLREEYDKDEEINKLKQELKEAKEDCRRGFSISEEEWERIKNWQREHNENDHGFKTLEQKLAAEGCCGGRYRYEFVPTSIGTIGTVVCSCGARFQFQMD